MKGKLLLSALSVMYISSGYGADFSIYLESEDPSSCHIDNVSSISVLPDGNLLAASGELDSESCNTGGNTSVPTVTLSANPTSLDFNQSSSPATTISWSATNVATCTTQGSSSGAFTAFTFSPSNSWPSASTTNICTPTNGACNGSFTATAVTNSTTSYTFGIMCYNTDRSLAALDSADVAVTATTGGGGGGGETCSTSQTSDFSGFTRLCTGKLVVEGTSVSVNSADLNSYNVVFGSAWPGSYAGFTSVITMGSTKYVSVPFTPTSAHTVQWTANQTYMPQNSTISVSTVPGKFTIAGGALCTFSRGASNSVIVSTNGNPDANCPALSASQTYYLNFVNASSSGGSTCSGSSCNVAYQLGILN